MQLRYYQRDAVDAVWQHLRDREDNPCVVIPTAGGKTPVIATLCQQAVEQWQGRVMVLAHVKELVEQAVDKLAAFLGPFDVGVYAAGMKRRDTDHPVIAAQIQSVYKRAAEIGSVDLLLADECHLIPPSGEGMYRSFLADMKEIAPHVRVVGLTATPYRMKGGDICSPDNVLNHVCYEIGVGQLIQEGYLCPLRSKAGKRKADMSGVHVRGGEFIASELEGAMDEEELVRAACAEIAEATADRNATLLFAAGIKHGAHIVRLMQEEHGIECGFVTGKTSRSDRDEIIRRFQQGDLRYLCNVNVLTTGFDAPHIDCVAMLRPTLSPGLYYQQLGRGFRLHESKTDCLVLDFAGNILRHGPVDIIEVGHRGKAGTGLPPVKECPSCGALIPAGHRICPECSHEFPKPEANHEKKASEAAVLSADAEPEEFEVSVSAVRYLVHQKRGADEDAPKTVRVEYTHGAVIRERFSEWICPEHTGWARRKFERWWKARTDLPLPRSASAAAEVGVAGGLAEPQRIRLRKMPGEKWPEIVGYEEMADKPDQEEVLRRLARQSAPLGDDFDSPLIPDDEIPF